QGTPQPQRSAGKHSKNGEHLRQGEAGEHRSLVSAEELDEEAGDSVEEQPGSSQFAGARARHREQQRKDEQRSGSIVELYGVDLRPERHPVPEISDEAAIGDTPGQGGRASPVEASAKGAEPVDAKGKREA